MANESPEAAAQQGGPMDKHEFSPQYEPFTNLCSECGMGKIAIYHNGPRYQTVVVTGRNKIIDREGARGQIATADSDEDAQTITAALNSYDALRAAAVAAEAWIVVQAETWTCQHADQPMRCSRCSLRIKAKELVNQLRAALHPQPEQEGK